MKYYIATKRNEALIHVTAQMSLEIFMLCEKSQHRKTVYRMIPYEMSRIGRSIESENR